MANVDHTCWTDSCSEASHDTFEMDIYFFETDSMENWVNYHFQMPSDENIRHYDNAVETFPFFFRYFDLVLDQMNKQIFQIWYPLLLVLLATNI